MIAAFRATGPVIKSGHVMEGQMKILNISLALTALDMAAVPSTAQTRSNTTPPDTNNNELAGALGICPWANQERKRCQRCI